METEHYPHKVAAVYPSAAAAEAARQELLRAGLVDIDIRQVGPATSDLDARIEPEQRQTRNRFIEDILTGTALGGVAGAAAAGAAAALVPTLFVAAPVLGPLMAVGYAATLGGGAGAVKAFKVKEGMLAGVVEDAAKNGLCSLVIHTPDAETNARVEQIVERTLADKTVTA